MTRPAASPRQTRARQIAAHGRTNIEWSPGVWVSPAESRRRAARLTAHDAREAERAARRAAAHGEV